MNSAFFKLTTAYVSLSTVNLQVSTNLYDAKKTTTLIPDSKTRTLLKKYPSARNCQKRLDSSTSFRPFSAFKLTANASVDESDAKLRLSSHTHTHTHTHTPTQTTTTKIAHKVNSTRKFLNASDVDVDRVEPINSNPVNPLIRPCKTNCENEERKRNAQRR